MVVPICGYSYLIYFNITLYLRFSVRKICLVSNPYALTTQSYNAATNALRFNALKLFLLAIKDDLVCSACTGNAIKTLVQ